MSDADSPLRQLTHGRRVDGSRDARVLDAALAVLGEHGYRGANMDDVAARARVGKAAIYQRWSSKAALMTDALVYWRPNYFGGEAPDTGSLTGDFDAFVDSVARNDGEPISIDLILRVALEAARDPLTASAFDELMLHRGTRVIAEILHRAATRGEIPGGRDWSLLAQCVTAMGLMNITCGHRVDAG